MRAWLRAAVLSLGVVLVMTSLAAAADRDGDGLQDAFEAKWGVTDPRQRDTDGDGVIDAAEDDDGDRLGNLGEQRFGTDPGDPDSDDDGVPDGAEDKDGDGVSNAREQDQRAVPKGLTPALAQAADDVPEAHADCFVGLGSATVRRCRFGDPQGAATVAIFGDSHALQWVPALHRAGQQDGWQLVTLLKGGCPSVQVITTGQFRIDGDRSCRRWRTDAISWLRTHAPDLVILANSDGYGIANERGRKVESVRARVAMWKQGLARTVKALRSRSDVVILGEGPDNDGDPVKCLQANSGNIAACTSRRTKPRQRKFEKAERQLADASGAQFRSLYGKVCSYDPCPLIQGDVLMWRDHAHLTATFVERLAPSMAELVASVMGPEFATTAQLGPPAPPSTWSWLTWSPAA